MKRFGCQVCGQVLVFENTSCLQCGHVVGYDALTNQMLALEVIPPAVAAEPLVAGQEPAVDQVPARTLYRCTGAPGGELVPDQTVWAFCDNMLQGVCNWLVDSGGDHTLCLACQHNKLIPDLTIEGNLERWTMLEYAKHRLFYSILRLHLPVQTRLQNPTDGLEFDFLADTQDGSDTVMTGHEDGLITIAAREADDVEREKMRVSMGENYRTLLGHFRHEIGHYFWNVLVRDRGLVEECRTVFGDESVDYGEALKAHYDNGPPVGWQDHFITPYAAAHPWEDFAETWAHYLHIVDALESAADFAVGLDPALPVRLGTLNLDSATRVNVDFDPYIISDFSSVSGAWLPFSSMMTMLNRSMGLSDFYPFVLTESVLSKLTYIHRLIHQEPILAPV